MKSHTKTLRRTPATERLEAVLGLKRECSRCNTERSLTMFKIVNKVTDELDRICHPCRTSDFLPPITANSKSAICACCRRKLPHSAFGRMESREYGIDSACRDCRPLLRIHKNIGRWEPNVALTAEEVGAARLLSEIKQRAKESLLYSTLDWHWCVEQLGPWRCADTGVRLSLVPRKNHSFAPTVKMHDPRRGFTQKNSRIIAKR